MMEDFNHAVILTVEEAAELAAYMEHQYLDKNKMPALCKLLERLTPKPEARP